MRLSTSCASRIGAVTRRIGSSAKHGVPSGIACSEPLKRTPAMWSRNRSGKQDEQSQKPPGAKLPSWTSPSFLRLTNTNRLPDIKRLIHKSSLRAIISADDCLHADCDIVADKVSLRRVVDAEGGGDPGADSTGCGTFIPDSEKPEGRVARKHTSNRSVQYALLTTVCHLNGSGPSGIVQSRPWD